MATAYRVSQSGKGRFLGFAACLALTAGALFALEQGLLPPIFAPAPPTELASIEEEEQVVPEEPEIIEVEDPAETTLEIFVQEPEITVEGPPATNAPAQTTFTPPATTSGNRVPEYPRSSIERCEQGTVTLRLVIGTNGRVIDAEVAESSGYPALDAAALKAAGSWRFKPATRDGEPVESAHKVDVVFDLRNEVGASLTERDLRECLAGG